MENQYYVMSLKNETNVLKHLRGIDAILVKDINDTDENIQDESDIDSNFEKIYLVTTNFKNYNFSIRGMLGFIYIVSSELYNLLVSFDVDIKFECPLVLVNKKNLNEVNENGFMIVIFNEKSYIDIFDINYSSFDQEFPETIDNIYNIKFKKEIDYDFLLIEEMNANYKTPIISERLKARYDQLNLKGIDFYKLESAPWQNEDSMQFYFEKETAGTAGDFVDPI